MKKIIGLLLVVALAACSSTSKSTTTPATPMASMKTPAEIQAAWEQAGTPGEFHQLLAPMAGKWKTTSTCYMSGPDGKPTTSSGTATKNWMLGKRFMEERYTGTFFGKPFEGFGILGYDNVAKRYTSTWVDSMSTVTMTATGNFDKASNTFWFNGSYNDPVTGGTKFTSYTVKMANKDKMFFEMFEGDTADKLTKSVEIEYTRIR